MKVLLNIHTLVFLITISLLSFAGCKQRLDYGDVQAISFENRGSVKLYWLKDGKISQGLCTSGVSVENANKSVCQQDIKTYELNDFYFSSRLTLQLEYNVNANSIEALEERIANFTTLGTQDPGIALTVETLQVRRKIYEQRRIEAEKKLAEFEAAFNRVKTELAKEEVVFATEGGQFFTPKEKSVLEAMAFLFFNPDAKLLGNQNLLLLRKNALYMREGQNMTLLASNVLDVAAIRERFINIYHAINTCYSTTDGKVICMALTYGRGAKRPFEIEELAGMELLAMNGNAICGSNQKEVRCLMGRNRDNYVVHKWSLTNTRSLSVSFTESRSRLELCALADEGLFCTRTLYNPKKKFDTPEQVLVEDNRLNVATVKSIMHGDHYCLLERSGILYCGQTLQNLKRYDNLGKVYDYSIDERGRTFVINNNADIFVAGRGLADETFANKSRLPTLAFESVTLGFRMSACYLQLNTVHCASIDDPKGKVYQYPIVETH